MVYSGINSNLPGFVIEQYIWDFGDGGFAEGPEVEHVYENRGLYEVKLGLKGHMEGGSNVEIRCVERKVVILSDQQDQLMHNPAQSNHTDSNQ